MSQTTALIAEHFADWGFVPVVVGEVFEDTAPAQIAVALDAFSRRWLGASIERSEFFRVSVGGVHGVRLHDGRRVVIKAHRPGTSVAFLAAMQRVQKTLAADGFPCPRPLLGPTPIGNGVAVAESLVDRGGPADAHEPSIRRELARALARLVKRCRSLTRLEALRRGNMERPPGQLWPRPHDGRFDFEATTAGAEWIDRIALAARRDLDRSRAGELVVGHADWRVGNMRVAEGKVSAVYDWDSLRIMREPELVGSVAHLFTADFGAANERRLPTLAEALAFASDYEAAGGNAFTSEEQGVLRAALAYSMGYTARCEHSDRCTNFGRHDHTPQESLAVPLGSARAFLATHAAELLDAPVGAVPAIEPAVDD